MSKQSGNEGMALQQNNDPTTVRDQRGISAPELREAVWKYVFELTATYDAVVAESARGSTEAQAKKASLEAELARWVGLADRIQERVPRSLFHAYEPMLHKATKQVAGFDPNTPLYQYVLSDLHLVFARKLCHYDPSKGQLASFLWSWLRTEAMQSASRYQGFNDVTRRHYRAVNQAIQHLIQVFGRQPRTEEIIVYLEKDGIALDEVTVQTLTQEVIVVDSEMVERAVDEVEIHPAFERIDQVRDDFAKCWETTDLDPVDVFLIAVRHIVDVQDREISEWAEGADEGQLEDAIEQVCAGLGHTWFGILNRIGVPKRFRITPTAARERLLACGWSTKTSSLQKRRRRKEIALKRAKFDSLNHSSMPAHYL